jgi:hypothetical protein
MTTQLIIDLANKVNQIDPRISAYAEGGYIKGCFRGKGKENYSFLVSAREFQYNNEGPNVEKAIKKAILELLDSTPIEAVEVATVKSKIIMEIRKVVKENRLIVNRVKNLLDMGFTVERVRMGSGGVMQVKEMANETTRVQIGYGVGKYNYAMAVII